MEKEAAIFEEHVYQRGLKHSQKRTQILRTFLNTQKHISAEELFQLVKQNHPEIGVTTIYRTIKLIVDSGIAEVVDFEDGVKRYERKLGREYHAHLICTKCGENLEAFDQTISQLCIRLAQEKGFSPQMHRYEIFGICEGCKK